MKNTTEEKSICARCHSDMQKKDVNPAQLDINTQSLLLMFRIHEPVILECSGCGHQGLHI